MLPGVARRFPVSSWVGDGVSGGSGDQHTFSFFMSLAFSSLRMTLHRGQTEVFEMSEMRNCSGCSLLPVPMEEMMGIPMPGSVFCQGQLGCHGIDCVQDIGNGVGGSIRSFMLQRAVQIVRKHELLTGDHLGVRTDVPRFFLS